MRNLKVLESIKQKAGLLALAGAIALPVLAATPQSAEAAPPRHAPAWGYRDNNNRNNNRRDRREDRRERRQERREDRRERREDRRDRRDDRRDDRWDGRGGNYNDGGFYGTVTRVRSSRSFDVNIDDNTFNVYTNSVVPGSLSSGDAVRVYGDRVGKNDIRNASVRIVGNR